MGEKMGEKIRDKIGWEEERCEGERRRPFLEYSASRWDAQGRKITPWIAVSVSVGVIVNK
jgi:hypothetical protein